MTDKQTNKKNTKVDKNTGKNSGIENLKPWKKGESGNPLGRPKKELSMTHAMKEILLEEDPKTKIVRYKKLLNVAIEKAEKGDNDMIKYLVNRIDGLPKGSETNVQVNNFIPLLGGDSHKDVIEVEDD